MFLLGQDAHQDGKSGSHDRKFWLGGIYMVAERPVTARRIGRWALYGLGGLVVIVVIAFAAAEIYLATPAGRAMVARQIAARNRPARRGHECSAGVAEFVDRSSRARSIRGRPARDHRGSVGKCRCLAIRPGARSGYSVTR